MSGQACPIPTPPPPDEAEAIRRMLAMQRIAIIGLSDDPSRPSHQIGQYLLSQGKQIFPVNPNHGSLLGQKCYASIGEVPGPIELVNVFRRPEFCPQIVREAIAAGAKGVWLQSGVISPEAATLAHKSSLLFVQNRCIMVEHMRHNP